MYKDSSDSQILPWIEESANPNGKTLIGESQLTSQAKSQSEEQLWTSFFKSIVKLMEPELKKPLLTQQFLKILITQKILKERNPFGEKKAIVLALRGELGAGKTTFVQGLAKGLGIKEKITSPTFTIVKRFNNFYHIDCYRIKKTKEILVLDFEEMISNPKNIIAIEWADQIKEIMPKNTIWINFELINQTTRKISLSRSYF